jgi:mannose-6-phosphate isomerase-like protein (cupin superfamily)
MKNISRSTAGALLVFSLAFTARAEIPEAQSEVVSVDDVAWGYLNPARGDKGPRAADLWGDRTKNTAAGILLQFPEGFSSPPHIHNITYRGVVIQGELHNDDPEAGIMWLPAGSFWTQPAGEAHVTAANGKRNIAYIEINSGPYLVQPTEQAFDNGERPVNVDPSNIVWLDSFSKDENGLSDIRVAYLWGDTAEGNLRGTMLKLPGGFEGKISTNANEFKAIVIEGDIGYKNQQSIKKLAPGSYFGSTGHAVHEIGVNPGQVSALYIRSDDTYDILAD